MTVYWLLFALPLVGYLASGRISISSEKYAWFFLMCIWIVVIGLRDGPGCDWDTYVLIYQRAKEQYDQFNITDTSPTVFFVHIFDYLRNWFYKPGYYPGYTLAMIVSWIFGSGLYGTNTICAAIAVIALGQFCRRNPSPWTAWVMATYLLTVVYMGYSRQGVAISLFALALTYLKERQRWHFIILVLIGTTFHKSAIFFVPLALIYSNRLTFKNIVIISIPLVLVGVLVISVLHGHYRSYLEGMWHSTGSYARVWMTALPAVIFLITSKQLLLQPDAEKLLRLLSIVAILLGLTVGFATTPIDRISLYLIPVQIMLWSNISTSFQQGKYFRPINAILFVLYASMLLIWFTWSTNARWWIPYRSVLATIA